MTISERVGFQAPVPFAYTQAYEDRPTVGCSVCWLEFSDVVGYLHSARTGHAVVPVAKAVAV